MSGPLLTKLSSIFEMRKVIFGDHKAANAAFQMMPRDQVGLRDFRLILL